jgi:hypothetical protein
MNSHESTQENKITSPFLKFFIFCSAADKSILQRCPVAEQHKYASIGATVFFTGALATLSGGYALYTIFQNVAAAIGLGIFWGCLIFNLDRFIVSTIKKNEYRWAQWKQILPRLFLAVFLALVISKPLELKIFEQEINEHLHYTGMQKTEQSDRLYDQKMKEKADEILLLNGKTEDRFVLRENYYEAYKCECEGTCGTGAKGVGSECKRKEEKYQKADREYQETKSSHDKQITQVREEIQHLKNEKEKHRNELNASFANGLMARLNALHELPAGPSMAIVLLLICIEIAPIFAKVLSPYGPYDHLLKSIEYEYEIEELASINIRNQKLNNHLTLMASVEQEKVEQQILNNKETLYLIEQAHLELVKEQLELWVENEKIKLRDKMEA